MCGVGVLGGLLLRGSWLATADNGGGLLINGTLHLKLRLGSVIQTDICGGTSCGTVLLEIHFRAALALSFDGSPSYVVGCGGQVFEGGGLGLQPELGLHLPGGVGDRVADKGPVGRWILLRLVCNGSIGFPTIFTGCDKTVTFLGQCACGVLGGEDPLGVIVYTTAFGTWCGSPF